MAAVGLLESMMTAQIVDDMTDTDVDRFALHDETGFELGAVPH